LPAAFLNNEQILLVNNSYFTQEEHLTGLVPVVVLEIFDAGLLESQKQVMNVIATPKRACLLSDLRVWIYLIPRYLIL
jgi:hypothetical protein